jgi:hypothetical protein
VKIPSWAEGRVLPPFGPSTPSFSRDVFAIQVEEIGGNNSITKGTLMLVRGWHKLIWYFGFSELDSDQEMVELYDLRADPQELRNLAIEGDGLTDQLLKAAKTKLAEMDQGG